MPLVLLQLRLNLGRHVVIRIYVLHIVRIFEGVDELHDLASGVGIHINREVGHELRLRRVVVDTGRLQGFPSSNKVRRVGDDLEAGAAVAAGARVEGSLLLPGARVGAGARITGAILGPGVEVAPGTVVAGELLTAGPDGPPLATPLASV